MQEKTRKLIKTVILISFYSLITLPVFGEEGVFLKPWQILQTQYTVIKFKSDDDLARFHKSINFSPSEMAGRAGTNPEIAAEDADSIAKKVDAVFERVQEILDMKKRFNPVNIHLYSNTDGLKKAYESLYSDECRLRAWYRFSNNTVYLNVRDVHEGMLAHELAHAIIDHFLAVRPPPQTAEILARYVDAHLERGFVR